MTNLTVACKRGHVIYVRGLAASHVSLNPMLYEYLSLDSIYVSGLATWIETQLISEYFEIKLSALFVGSEVLTAVVMKSSIFWETSADLQRAA
jgi:hypothetical protein